MFLSKKTKKSNPDKIRCSVVIVAAGSAQRFGADKLTTELLGIPVVAYSLSIYQFCDYVDEIILVTAEDKLVEMAQLCDAYGYDKVSRITLGGSTRVKSALSGVCECKRDATLIAVHDGARPLVTLDVINKAIECANAHLAAVPAIPARDTIKIAQKSIVSKTPNREETYQVQTPQVFEPSIIKGALTNALTKQLKVFDDASAVEALGVPIYLSEGSEENIKITTPLDMKLAESILLYRKARFSAEKEGVR